ncbi:hypothetical protein CDAR_212781 [Caerostris darwini]|uniref:Uncharacterized protein n=1 Tax=Caerostris darwini TaxID=1538125 RepID=A0AAV4PUY2_9ARAC|nr:hypothetical protein CDAR_212781 [Caerostris darwini]
MLNLPSFQRRLTGLSHFLPRFLPQGLSFLYWVMLFSLLVMAHLCFFFIRCGPNDKIVIGGCIIVQDEPRIVLGGFALMRWGRIAFPVVMDSMMLGS